MFERFTKDARAVVEQAEHEARALGSPAVEAEHLLLALARRGDLPLGPDALVDALEIELATSLEAVGVTLSDFGPPPPSTPLGRLRFGASAKLGLQRALKAAAARSDKRLGARHVGLGVLQAEVGTVPRTLAAAGIERSALIAAL